MLGGIAVVIAILVLPPLILMGGMAVAALIGTAGTLDAEARHEGSELIDLTR